MADMVIIALLSALVVVSCRACCSLCHRTRWLWRLEPFAVGDYEGTRCKRGLPCQRGGQRARRPLDTAYMNAVAS